MSPDLTYPEDITDETELSWWLGRLHEWHRIAEGEAELDATWKPAGRLSYERRVAGRLADMERLARPVQQSDGWPSVTVPGTWNRAPLRATRCRCPRVMSECRPGCEVDHATAGPGHHNPRYDSLGNRLPFSGGVR